MKQSTGCGLSASGCGHKQTDRWLFFLRERRYYSPASAPQARPRRTHLCRWRRPPDRGARTDTPGPAAAWKRPCSPRTAAFSAAFFLTSAATGWYNGSAGSQLSTRTFNGCFSKLKPVQGEFQAERCVHTRTRMCASGFLLVDRFLLPFWGLGHVTSYPHDRVLRRCAPLVKADSKTSAGDRKQKQKRAFKSPNLQ